MTDAEWQYQWDQKCLRLEQENERLKAELEKAKKCFAEMREALKSHHEWSMYQSKNNQIVYTGSLRSDTESALSSDCGKDYFTKEQVMPLIKLLQDSLKALCAWGPSPADVFIVNEIQSALAHAKEIGLC